MSRIKHIGHVLCEIDTQCCNRDSRSANLVKRQLPLPQDRYLHGMHTLRVCRQVYTEAISVLYDSNFFEVSSLWTLLDLSKRTRPEYFALIRRLEVNVALHPNHRHASLANSTTADSGYAPLDNKTWNEFWSLIALGMPGLKELKAVLYDFNGFSDPDQSINWAEPLRKIKGLEKCTITLAPWRGNEKESGKIPEEKIKWALQLQDDLLRPV